MRKAILLFAGLFLFCNASTFSQVSCLSIVKPADTITVSCQAQCTDINIKIAGIHQNNTYNVNAITYSPFPFTNAFPGVAFSNLNNGNSAAITLPFPFGFYDSTYKKIVINTNGQITFDEALANGNINNYGNPPLPSTSQARAMIAALQEDLNFGGNQENNNAKLDTITIGTAPCRKFIISWSQVSQYNCFFQKITAQLALYEGSNKVEIYVANRSVCFGEGQASFIIGMQNWEQTAAHFPAGRNNSAVAITNEAYQFVPAGTGFLFNRAELYENGNFYTTGFVQNTAADSMDIVFGEICPQEGQTRKFTVRVYYRFSNATTDEFYITDSIVLKKLPCALPLTATTTQTNVSCNTGNNGQFIIHATGGTPPYQFSMNGANYFLDSTFSNLTANTYPYYVKDNSQNLPFTSTVTITQPSAIAANTTVVNVLCNNGNTGSITVNADGGTGALQYALNGGSYQPSNGFSNLTSATYSVTVKDGNNCTLTLNNIAVTQPGAITATAATVNVLCFGQTTGSITVTAGGGTGTLQYALNGGSYQASNVFSNLGAGLYSVTVKDANNCTRILGEINITQPASAITASTAVVNVLCNGAATGSITVTASGGTGTLQYALNGGGYQTSNVFSGLTAGSYSVTVRDANNCTKIVGEINITQPATAITASAAVVNVLCNGAATGSITVTASGGTGTLQYALNGGSYQASNVFSGLTAGSYSVTVRDANNCTRILGEINISQPSAITATRTVVNVLCNGTATGSITVTASGGTGALQYSLNGGPYQASNIFNGLIAGNYSVTVRDANNCTRILGETIITQPTALSATAATQNTTCSLTPNGRITITATGGTSGYTYSLNGGGYQASNVFTVGQGSYAISVKDANNCTFPLSAIVGITNDLTVSTIANTSLCSGSAVTLTTISNASSFSWSPAAGLSSGTAQSPVATPQSATTYTVTATLGQCTANASVTIGINPSPSVNAGTDQVIILGDNVDLNATASAGTYLWTPSTGLNATGTLTPNAKPVVTTTYIVRVTNNSNCFATDDVVITVLPDCVKPKNAFSPNGDGINDKWLVTTGNCTKNVEVVVFNRNGSKMFESKDYRNTWDGTYKGEPAADGTYYFVVKYTYVTGKEIILRGNVTILR